VITGWTLQFNMTPGIRSIYNARIVGHSPGRYAVRNPGYNPWIFPGETVSFTFRRLPGAAFPRPSGYVFNGVPVA